jgi:hypothetical protein
MRRYGVALAAVLLISGCDTGPRGPADNLSAPPVVAVENTSSPASQNLRPTPAPVAPAEPVRPHLSGPQANAVRSAENYLAMKGFSKAGLIEQLSSEFGDGYSRADATAAVNSLDVDWNENAVRSARDYLNMRGFSCNGLIEQLSSPYGDKYTRSEATYGARQAGAC